MCSDYSDNNKHLCVYNHKKVLQISLHAFIEVHAMLNAVSVCIKCCKIKPYSIPGIHNIDRNKYTVYKH